jgi:hypothetical protein
MPSKPAKPSAKSDQKVQDLPKKEISAHEAKTIKGGAAAGKKK